MVDVNLVALLALATLAVLLSIYLLKIDDNVGHLFMLLGVGLCVVALLPYVLNTPSDISTCTYHSWSRMHGMGSNFKKKKIQTAKKTFLELLSFFWNLLAYSLLADRSGVF